MTKRDFMQSPLFGKPQPLTGFNGQNLVQLNCCFIDEDCIGQKVVLTGKSAAGTKDFETCAQLSGHSSFVCAPDDARVVYRVHGVEYHLMGLYPKVRVRKTSKGSTLSENIICLRAAL